MSFNSKSDHNRNTHNTSRGAVSRHPPSVLTALHGMAVGYVRLREHTHSRDRVIWGNAYLGSCCAHSTQQHTAAAYPRLNRRLLASYAVVVVHAHECARSCNRLTFNLCTAISCVRQHATQTPPSTPQYQNIHTLPYCAGASGMTLAPPSNDALARAHTLRSRRYRP